MGSSVVVGIDVPSTCGEQDETGQEEEWYKIFQIYLQDVKMSKATLISSCDEKIIECGHF
jgi:hypothetical protein